MAKSEAQRNWKGELNHVVPWVFYGSVFLAVIVFGRVCLVLLKAVFALMVVVWTLFLLIQCFKKWFACAMLVCGGVLANS